MVSQAKWAMGTLLKRAGTAVAELNNVGGVKLKADTIEVTSHDSVGSYKEFVQGMKDAGEVQIEGNFIPGDTNGQIQMLTDFGAGTTSAYTIDFPAAMAAQWSFNAVITGWETLDAKTTDKAGFRATLKITGQPTLNITLSAGLTTPFFTMSTGTIIPTASGSVYYYVVEVVTGTTGVTVTPTATAGVITVTKVSDMTSQVVASGNPSSTITLGVAGSVTTLWVDVKETNKVGKRYIIDVARA